MLNFQQNVFFLAALVINLDKKAIYRVYGILKEI